MEPPNITTVLRELHIRDLGVIREASVSFDPGLNVITGETGVGKTLLVTGMRAITGGRASSGLVAEGADEACVEAIIDPPSSARPQLLELDLDPGEELVIARKIGSDGRSRAWLGGRLVPASTLAELDLVQLCGQGSGSALARPAAQLAAIDALASNGELVTSFRSVRARSQELVGETRRLRAEVDGTAQQAELLAFQVAEIDRAELEVGEDEALEAEISKLEHAERLNELAIGALELVGPEGAAGAVAEAHKLLEPGLRFDPSLQPLVDRLADAAAETAELGREIRMWAEGLDGDPSRLDGLRERRALIATLRRKYGSTVADILAVADEARRKLEGLESGEGRLGTIESELEAAQAKAASLADELSIRRRDAAGRLTELVSAELPALALPRASFEVVCTSTEELTADGRDSITFVFSADRRRRAEPIGKVASGGELSRAMIATTLALASVHEVGVLVFDEADQGVGGEAALELARRLSRLASGHQVLVVSHLPQIAAFADRHIVVDKGDDGEVSVQIVTAEQRLTELSRMLAGLESSERARAHAAELLELAGAERATSGAAG